MTPLQSYNNFLVTFSTLCRPLGLVITDPQYRVSLSTYMFSVITVMYCVCSLYTLGTYDFTEAVQCATLCGVGFQGPIKIYTAVTCAGRMNDQLIHNAKMYEAIERSTSTKLRANINWFGPIFRKVIVVFVSLVVGTGCSIALFPGLMYVLTGQRFSILSAFIPWVDENELQGYFITLAFHLWCCVLACIGEFLADGLFMACVLHLWPMYSAIEVYVEELNESLRRNEIVMARLQFRNILLLHQDVYR